MSEKSPKQSKNNKYANLLHRIIMKFESSKNKVHSKNNKNEKFIHLVPKV